MATKQPYVPVTTNNNYFRGIDPVARTYGGKDATQDQRQAYDLVESQFGPQRIAQQRQLSHLGRDHQQQVQTQEKFGEFYGDRLQNVSNELQGLLSGVTDRTQQAYGGASQVIQDAYGRAQQGVEGASDNVQADLIAQMQRLGLMEAGRDPQAHLTQQTTDMSGRHAISGAGATGNIEALGADMTGIAAKRQGDAAQDWAGKQSDLAHQVMATVQQINEEYNTQRDNIFSEINALEKARGEALSSTMYDVINERLERERQGRLDNLAEEMARRGMSVQEGYLGLSGQRFGLEQELGRGNLDVARGHLGVSQGGLELQRQSFEEERKALQAEIAAADSPSARLRAQLELQLLEAEIEDIYNSINNPTGSSKKPSGLSGVKSYTEGLVGLTPQRQAEIYQEFNNAVSIATDQAVGTAGNRDDILKQMLDAQYANNPTDRNLFNELYHIYLGDY